MIRSGHVRVSNFNALILTVCHEPLSVKHAHMKIAGLSPLHSRRAICLSEETVQFRPQSPEQRLGSVYKLRDGAYYRGKATPQ